MKLKHITQVLAGSYEVAQIVWPMGNGAQKLLSFRYEVYGNEILCGIGYLFVAFTTKTLSHKIENQRWKLVRVRK